MRNVVPPPFRIAAGLLSTVLLGIVGCHVLPWRNPVSPEALLKRADEMSWLNSWIEAEPLYKQAESEFLRRHQLAKALYAHVSETPAQSESSTSIQSQIGLLRNELLLPEANDPETRLRILTVLGMLEVNYDSGMARDTWTQVENLALRRQHYLLASRAIGEQGIAAFLLGDIGTAKKDVVKAWIVAKTADPGAHIRYASMYGTGLVELNKYNEAIGPLNEALKVAKDTPGAAYPTIALTAKIKALSGLGRNKEALAVASEEMAWVSSHHLAEHLCDIYQTRAGVYEKMSDFNRAVSDYGQAARCAKQLSFWRGLTQIDGSLGKTYLEDGELQPALDAINEAIEANEHIPDELYFVPRNLSIKAQILARMGNVNASNALYQKGADLLDALLSNAPTPTIERQLLGELSEIYSGYFASLRDQGRTGDAFHTIERARGRVEAQSLRRHDVVTPHELDASERHLNQLNISLLNTDDSTTRGHILDSIYEAEQQLDPTPKAGSIAAEPVELAELQSDLRPSELFVEYVLDGPQSNCQGRSKTRPVGRSKSRPVDGLEVLGYSGSVASGA